MATNLMRLDDPAFVLWIDEHHIAHVQTQMLWTPETADRYWTAFGPYLRESRSRLGGNAKVLVDRRGTPAMPVELIHLMRDGINQHYSPDDRLALVVDSSPLKSQVRQNYLLDNLEAFLSYDAALAWLINQ